MNKKQHLALVQHFEQQWRNPPAPFNPQYKYTKQQLDELRAVTLHTMELEGVYALPLELRVGKYQETWNKIEANGYTADQLSAAREYLYES